MDNAIFFDYCHRPYTPPKTKRADKLYSCELLFASLGSGWKKKLFADLVKRLQSAIGRNSTVWGIKHRQGLLSWELYFYNDDRNNLEINIDKIAHALKPLFKINVDIKSAEAVPYFMFSFCIDDMILKTRDVDGLNIYMGTRGRACEGFSYLVRGKLFTIRNQYAFYDPKHEHKELISKISKSPFINIVSKKSLKKILMPRLIKCHTVCVAHKSSMDGIYFSQVGLGQFLYFLKHFDFPSPIIAFIEKNKTKLNHMLYDVAFDYRMSGDEMIFGKQSYYGVF